VFDKSSPLNFKPLTSGEALEQLSVWSGSALPLPPATRKHYLSPSNCQDAIIVDVTVAQVPN